MISFRSLFVRFRPSPVWVGSLGVLTVLMLLSGSFSAAHAQTPGTLDNSFAPNLDQVTAYAVAVDSQGRVVVGGDSQLFLRYFSAGELDTSFPNASFGGSGRVVFGLAIDSADRTYAVGGFGKKDANKKSINITRVNSDGVIDGTFHPGTGANDIIIPILLQTVDADPDNNKILIGGLFEKYNGEHRGRIARLNADGSLDGSFDPDLNFDDGVFALAFQTAEVTTNLGLESVLNGQILVGGQFEKVNDSKRAKLVRLNSDGGVDTSFSPEIDGSVFAIAVQPDGKIIIGGDFEEVNGVESLGLARLNPDGSLDGSFRADVTENDNNSVPPTAVYVLRLQADGRLLVGGNFLEINNVKRRFLGRLEADGSVDSSFDPGDGIANRVESLDIQPDNNILVAESVSKRIGADYPVVVRRVFGDPVDPAVAQGPVAAELPTVSIAGVSAATELGTPGVFKITRESEDMSQPLDVFYTMREGSGDMATMGVDYAAPTGRVTIPANKKSAQIKIFANQDNVIEGVERVSLRLQTSAAYQISVRQASIKIRE
jgi:uncharacterized delta-60 repeat protein